MCMSDCEVLCRQELREAKTRVHEAQLDQNDLASKRNANNRAAADDIDARQRAAQMKLNAKVASDRDASESQGRMGASRSPRSPRTNVSTSVATTAVQKGNHYHEYVFVLLLWLILCYCCVECAVCGRVCSIFKVSAAEDTCTPC